MRLKPLQTWGHSVSKEDTSDRMAYKIPPLGLVSDRSETSVPETLEEQKPPDSSVPLICALALSVLIGSCTILLAAGYLYTQGRLSLTLPF